MRSAFSTFVFWRRTDRRRRRRFVFDSIRLVPLHVVVVVYTGSARRETLRDRFLYKHRRRRVFDNNFPVQMITVRRQTCFMYIGAH